MGFQSLKTMVKAISQLMGLRGPHWGKVGRKTVEGNTGDSDSVTWGKFFQKLANITFWKEGKVYTED